MAVPMQGQEPRQSTEAESLEPEVFERLYDSAPDAMILIDTDGNILHANARAQEMFGFALDELVGQPAHAFLPEALEEERVRQEGGFFSSADVRALSLGMEVTAVRRDGARFPVDVMLSSIELPRDLKATLAVVRDISERSRFEHSLKQNIAILERLFEFAPDSMIVVNPEGAIVRANVQTETMFGFSRGELLGAPLEILIPTQFRDRHKRYRDQYFHTPRLRPMGIGLQLYGRRKDGTEFPVDIMLSPMDADQGAPMALAVVRDMTLRAKLAEQEQMRRSLEQKDTLIKEIHHRVKNNLQVISSLLSLQADQLGAWVEGKLRDTQTRVRSIALIHEKLSRGDDTAQLDFRAYLQDLIDDLNTSYGEDRAIEIRLEADSRYFGLDTAIPCGLIVVELVTNALKYAFPKRRDGLVLVQFKASETGNCALRVSDDGVGIPDRVNVEKPATLGLQLVQALTQQLGGQLAIRRGEGTTVEIHFRPHES